MTVYCFFYAFGIKEGTKKSTGGWEEINLDWITG